MRLKIQKMTIARLTGSFKVSNFRTPPTTGCMTADSTPTPTPTPTPTKPRPKTKMYF